jgi:hypothetical protein
MKEYISDEAQKFLDDLEAERKAKKKAAKAAKASA